jgi:D-alanyl-D-alanine dipeptidase
MPSHSRRAIPDISHVHGTLHGAHLSDEPLVPLQHKRITSLHTYLNDGWREATELCVVREGVAAALYTAAAGLPPGWGIAIHDAWRPAELQAALYSEAVAVGVEPGFVEPPSHDDLAPPPHVTGGAVDVTLTWKGQVLCLGTEFDDFSPDAYLRAFEHTPGWVQEARRELYWAMRGAGFVGLPNEWWHYELRTRRWAAAGGGNATALYGAVPALVVHS